VIVPKKEYEALKKKVNEQEVILSNMSFHLVQMQQELDELKKPKEPGYLA